jgi:hypothetical protein
MVHQKYVYAYGPNVFCTLEYSWADGRYGIMLVVYSPERRHYWLDTLGM